MLSVIKKKKSLYFRICTAALTCSLFLLPVFDTPAGNQEAAWYELLQGRAVALLRHATAPGMGDPHGFRIGDCNTQRNLSQEGRHQARRIGDFFRKNGVKEANIYSSQWCRCLDTAKLLNLGQVNELLALNSFFQDSSSERKQTMEMRQFIDSLPAGKPVIMVTHQVNITALTGIVPSSGEIVIFQLHQPLQAKVLGRFTP
jgi:phosphohistidine phosphatase SixA